MAQLIRNVRPKPIMQQKNGTKVKREALHTYRNSISALYQEANLEGTDGNLYRGRVEKVPCPWLFDFIDEPLKPLTTLDRRLISVNF